VLIRPISKHRIALCEGLNGTAAWGAEDC